MSILFVHQLVYTSPLMRLEFENILLQYEYDWMLVIDSPDLSLLKKLRLCPSSACQFVSMAEVMDDFLERIRTGVPENRHRFVHAGCYSSLQTGEQSSSDLAWRASTSNAPLPIIFCPASLSCP